MERRPIKGGLTADFVRSVLRYEPQTGEFRWKFRDDVPRQWNTRYAGSIAGYLSDGYRLIQLESDKGAYRAGRLAWLIMTGGWPTAQIDHINRIRDDDRWLNLRIASNGQNNANKAAQANNRTGLKGVSPCGGRWRARINAAGKTFRLGNFATPEEAAAAYTAAAKRLHGIFARN